MSSVSRRHPTRSLVRTICCLLMCGFIPLPCPATIPAPGPPADPAAEARSVQSERLRRHAFASGKRDDKAPGLLLGSANSRVQVFGGVPSAWKDFTFYQVPAESGLRVSGAMRDGEVRWVGYTRDGKLLRQSNRRESLRIRQNGTAVSLKEDKGPVPGK